MIRETKETKKMFEVLKATEIKQHIEKQLEDFCAFYDIVSGQDFCDADKKVNIDIHHTREELTGITCNKIVAQKILDLVKEDIEKQLNDAEKDLKALKKELKEIL